MEKYHFIKKQISKTNKKNDENYVVTRIWHSLNNYHLKMITQQYIVRDVETKRYALADIYFPQLNIIIEIDEPYHLSSDIILSDAIRQHDIVQALECEVFRVKVTDDLKEMNARVDLVIHEIQKRLKSNKFQPWDVDSEYNPMTYVKKGYIDATKHVAFKTIKDCCNCFGAGYKGFQGSGAKHKFQPAIDIKALKFYPNGEWDNKLDADEFFFTEYHLNATTNASYLQKRLYELRQELALFTHVRSEFGGFEYVFKGWYKVNHGLSLQVGKVTYERISKVMPTYYPYNQEQPKIIARATINNYTIAHFYDHEEVKQFKDLKSGIEIVEVSQCLH